MKKIAIIGLGNLGSRHLQALALLKETITIELVDVSESSLNIAVERFYEVPEAKNYQGTIHRYMSINNLSEQLDLVIVACNSKERRALTEELLNKKNVKYLILEKVLFPFIEDYEIIARLLKNKGVKAWVNCSRRMMPSYHAIKGRITPGLPIDISIVGSNWGMASNGIHFIDLFCYLTENHTLKLNMFALDEDNPKESNRKGYVDFTGTVVGKTERGDFFRMSSHSTGSLPIQVSIQTPAERILINEYLGNGIFSSPTNQWKGELFDFEIVYQSRLTAWLAESLFQTGTCDLTEYEEATTLHKLYLSSLMEYQTLKSGKEVNICQIT